MTYTGIRYFQISAQGKEVIIARIGDCLGKLSDLEFAYVHGSFVMENQFRDVDVAVYLKTTPSSPLQLELNLETELGGIVDKYPVDVRILNVAPLSFRYNVIRYGKPIAVINDDARCDFEELTLCHYFDFAPYRRMYLKETLGRGV